MWQALLAAAVAGSTGLVAKHFFSPSADLSTDGPNSQKNENSSDRQEEQETPVGSEEHKTPLVKHRSLDTGCECNCEKEDVIFRFSSSGSSSKSGCRSASKKWRKKVGLGARGVKKPVGAADKTEKRSGDGLEVRRRVFIPSKKTRITKNVAGKCGSCSGKDSSLFGWGLGVGIMYMMSTGKAEISKMNSAIDETAKVVEELKTELYRRKPSCSLQVSSSAYEVPAVSKKITGKDGQPVVTKSSTNNRGTHDVKVSGFPLNDDGEYASSVLTEEPESEPEVVEMDRLEAELESELLKLPGCATKASNHEGIGTNPRKAEVSAQGFHEMVDQSSEPYQCHGVLPSELNQKLCHLLIEQQENQIEELESELHTAQTKLHQKEAELQGLKDCVRHLTEFSLSNFSDDETEAKEEQEFTKACDNYTETGSEPRKSVLGMKRPIDLQ